MSSKKILHLTLKKQWFDAIVAGEKTTEYRTIKPYWTKRLEDKKYDLIYFKNGYGSDVPFMAVECLGVEKEIYHGEEKYAIKLGKVLKVENYNK